MRYSSYFRHAAALSQSDPVEAERILREAEAKASDSFPMDRILCARIWDVCLKNRDNALRCLFEAECVTNDTRGLLELALAYYELLDAIKHANRCVDKAVAAVDCPDDHDRIEDFVQRYSQHGINRQLRLEE